MKLCRIQPLDVASNHPDQTPAEAYRSSHAGILEGSVVREISGEIWGERQPTGRQWPVTAVRFVPPSWPSKIICIGLNFRDHAAEINF